jgi:hypothetical protein
VQASTDISKHHEKTHSLVRFLGFGGLVAVIGLAVTVGKYESSIETTVSAVKDQQTQLSQVITEIHVEQQEITDVDRRVTRLEDRK